MVHEMVFDEDNPKSANGKVHHVNGDIEMPDLKDKSAPFSSTGSPDPTHKLAAFDVGRSSPDLRTAPNKTNDPTEKYVDIRGQPCDKTATGTWRAVSFLYGIIFTDYLAFIATGANMVTYLITVMQLGISESSNWVTNWLGTMFVVPVFWGFVADAYLGRYWTMVVSGFIQIFGMLVLTISTALPSLRPPTCVRSLAQPICPRASDHDIHVLLTGLFVMAIGSAGIKTVVPPFGQEQFDNSDPVERLAGTHYFNWYFFASSMGNLLAYSVMVYVQDHASRGWGYGILTGLFFLAYVAFLVATPLYRHRKPSGSPLTRIAQVLVAAARHWDRPLPQDHQDLYELSFLDVDASAARTERLRHTNKLRFLDKAAIAKGAEIMSTVNPWRLCPVSQVEELKRVLLMLPIWFTNIFLFLAITQMSTYNVVQAETMDRRMGKHFQIPPASLGTFSVLAVVIITPLYDFLFVPFARKYTGHDRGITPLQRMGVGFVLALFGLMAAALVENRRVKQVRELGLGDVDFLLFSAGYYTLPIRVFWLVPQLVLIAGIEFFTNIAALEIFYGDAPNSMKSLASSLTFSTVGLGSFLTSSLVSLVNKYSKDSSNPHSKWLDGGVNHGGIAKFFWLLTVIVGIDFILFLFIARWYEYKKPDRVETVSSSQRYTVLEEARLSNFPENVH